MPTPEEIAAEKVAVEAKKTAEIAAKTAEEEAAKKAAEEKNFETWLSKQPKDIQERYNESVTGLKSALEKERLANKEAAKNAKRLADLEAEEKKRADAQLTELDKAKKEAAELKEKVAKSEHLELQRKIAEKVKLPAVFADRIQGTDEATMEADAKILLEAIPAKVPPAGKIDNPGDQVLHGTETDADRRKRIGI